MLHAKIAVHLLFCAILLGSGEVKGQREKCEAITELCKCLADKQPSSTCADPQQYNVTAGEVESAMACDVTLGT
jgi:hypothetical protein